MNKTSSFDYGWVVVAAGALMTCVGFGSMLSLAVFLQPISEAMGWSRAGVSAAATLDFLFMGVAAFFWGSLSDKFGTRIVVLSGSVLLGLGLVTASRAQSLWQFQLLFGGLIGSHARKTRWRPLLGSAKIPAKAPDRSGRTLVRGKKHAPSAVDLKFLPNLRRVRAGTSNPKTALAS